MTVQTSAMARPSKIYLQEYPWRTFIEREGMDWHDHPIIYYQQLMSSVFKKLEPVIDSFEYFEEMRSSVDWTCFDIGSVYLNAILHEQKNLNQRIDQVKAIAKFYAKLGAKIIVINPSPISWDEAVDKTDNELNTQVKALNTLSKSFAEMGLLLAYHNHDAEMRNNGRELYWMMQKTNPQYVRFCLDCHWIYRGSGNNSKELFRIIDLYADRIVELHLRQSSDGIWTEAFKEGDIDYQKVARLLKSRNLKPRLVLEQAVEEDTPHTMSIEESHRLGIQYASKTFIDF
jgi:inosose dehydratase